MQCTSCNLCQRRFSQSKSQPRENHLGYEFASAHEYRLLGASCSLFGWAKFQTKNDKLAVNRSKQRTEQDYCCFSWPGSSTGHVHYIPFVLSGWTWDLEFLHVIKCIYYTKNGLTRFDFEKRRVKGKNALTNRAFQNRGHILAFKCRTGWLNY